MQGNGPGLTHDLQEPPEGVPPFFPDILKTNWAPGDAEFANGSVFRISPRMCASINWRINTWTVLGHVDFSTGDSLDVSLDLLAWDDWFGENVVDEQGICRMRGWKGSGDQMFTEAMGGTSMVPMVMAFGEALKVQGDDTCIVGTETLPPTLELLAGAFGDYSGLSFGKTDEGDDCPIVITLPVTGGSFITPPSTGWEGFGPLHFTFQLGGPVPGVGQPPITVTGNWTMKPKSTGGYWEHNPNDGDGPIYDKDTGAWLRNARDPKFLMLPNPNV